MSEPSEKPILHSKQEGAEQRAADYLAGYPDANPEPSETSRDRSPAEPGPPTLPPTRVRVYCSQFAQCRWSGIRVSDRLGVQPKPCPRCGKEVVR